MVVSEVRSLLCGSTVAVVSTDGSDEDGTSILELQTDKGVVSIEAAIASDGETPVLALSTRGL